MSVIQRKSSHLGVNIILFGTDVSCLLESSRKVVSNRIYSFKAEFRMSYDTNHILTVQQEI